MKNTTSGQPFQPSFSLVQDTFSQIRELVSAQMRGAALDLLQGLFREEVERLCGKPFSRKGDASFHRGGSDPGSVILSGQRIKVKKPRVKSAGEEIQLDSYAAMQDFDLLCDRVMKHMISGVSTRNYEPLLEEISGSTGLKKSSVSKAFKMGSEKALEEINSRLLSSYAWLAVMIDSVDFAGRAVTVAMGVTTRGKKLVLGLREGNTENSEVVKDLLASLLERGMSEEPILFVLDGAKALKKGVRQVFADSPIQRCIRHKERNILEYLPKQYHMEFRRRWKLIHGSANYPLAKTEYERLAAWLEKINHAAHASLEESDQETLTAIRLGASKELRKSLQSTNPLESLFDGVRCKSGRVKNWKSGNTQISRWAAASLLAGEKKLRCIRGVKEIPIMLANLKSSLQSEAKIA